MKNLVAFLVIWLVVTGVYAWFGEANRSEMWAVMRSLLIGLLTAGITTGILTAIVILF